ncbi:MAG: hypothetical protein GC204_00875 [Chloroflexi bacterium]|nr:hypothetical protein [Chloroflexota bacterium]
MMLRFWVMVSLLATALFAGIGLAVSKAWGWSEYASDELYVVYSSGIRDPRDYSIVRVNPDDLEAREQLIWHDAKIMSLACSPDGRTLGFLTDGAQVVVMTSAGIRSEQREDETYSSLSITDNGTVVLFNAETGDLRIDATNINLSDLQHSSTGDKVKLSSQGLTLWTGFSEGVYIFSLDTREVVMSLPLARMGSWLAFGDIFAFEYPKSKQLSSLGLLPGLYLADVTSQKIVRLNDSLVVPPISPDGMGANAGLMLDGLQQKEQALISNPLNQQINGDILAWGVDMSNSPLCFLTFRPEMLLADNND